MRRVCFDETTIRPDEPYNQADVHNFLAKLSPLSTTRFRGCSQVFDRVFARDYPMVPDACHGGQEQPPKATHDNVSFAFRSVAKNSS